jgi:hypothetical protein
MEASIFHHFRLEVTAVPIPASAWLFGTGLAFLGSAVKYRRRKA